jgi:hypothetical protein
MGLLDWFRKSICVDNSALVSGLNVQISELKSIRTNLLVENVSQGKQIDDLNIQITGLKMRIAGLQIAGLPVVDPIETYWNDKRAKSESLTYPARPLFTDSTVKCYVDPRIYFVSDATIPNMKRDTNDQTAIASLDFVIQRVTYTADDGEFWQFPFETLKRMQGDCEDGAVLLANILLESGVPYWRIRLNAGSVAGGGHCYVTYLAEKDNTWYLLDWCYDYNLSQNLKRTFKSAQDYFGIWFSWNTKYIFPNDELDRETLLLNKVKGI